MHAFEKKYHWEWYRKWKKKYHNTDVPYWKNQNKWLLCIFPTDSLFVSLSLTYQFFTLQNLHHEMNYGTVCHFGIQFLLKCLWKTRFLLKCLWKHFSPTCSYISSYTLHVYDECIYTMNVFYKYSWI